MEVTDPIDQSIAWPNRLEDDGRTCADLLLRTTRSCCTNGAGAGGVVVGVVDVVVEKEKELGWRRASCRSDPNSSSFR